MCTFLAFTDSAWTAADRDGADSAATPAPIDYTHACALITAAGGLLSARLI